MSTSLYVGHPRHPPPKGIYCQWIGEAEVQAADTIKTSLARALYRLSTNVLPRLLDLRSATMGNPQGARSTLLPSCRLFTFLGMGRWKMTYAAREPSGNPSWAGHF